jgi:hypothetical protein
MSKTLFFFAFILTISAFILLFGQATGVVAIGAATDNTTLPNVPTGDQTQDEIEPLVKYVLLGPSSLPESASPSFVSEFIGALGEHPFEVIADETWYLDVEINMPGWLYIYDYFPFGGSLQGQWIAYKWQLQESGIWRLGPFTASDNEPEGQHIYRIWFYSDGQWASEEPGIPMSNLIYWTYSKGQPVEQPATQMPPQPPIAPVKETGGLDRVYEIITQPLVLVIGIVLLIAIVAVGLYLLKIPLRWRRVQDTVSLFPEELPELLPVTSPSIATSARIVLPNGIEIRLDGNPRVIGRGDLARALSLDELGLISRRHFEVTAEDEQFYIEDMGSGNGTQINGEDIGGRGPVRLSNDDVIEPAGAIQLRFLIL